VVGINKDDGRKKWCERPVSPEDDETENVHPEQPQEECRQL
jgi:hypothetical protein